MHFAENKEDYKRGIIFVLLILFTAILQNTNGLFPRIGNASAMLLLPLVISIAMFERDLAGMLFGLFAGFVWDFYSAHIDGYYIIFLTCAGYACSYLISRYMRNNIVTAMVYSSVLSLLCVTLYWLLFVVFNSVEGAWLLYYRVYLVSAAYTVALTPLYYYFVRAIALKFRKVREQQAL
ncbi:MAG: rod shape-determining protein MreD [Acutalibacteraceae bacterium]